ncbi:sperm-associated antigen 16 protein isoform X2 [Meriones unguiculatus]|uniref:sperm-associated antigen 16 protein isoform X2 n=1 Tax=Meriones unguiculatus TaxID=10047 RepID=UPI00293EAA1E|nr:sperm-associated antigen 16 protein isoform X2 [Meriones unguiculatus]
MAAQRGVPPMRMLEEALGISLTSSGDTPEPVAADGAYYLEHVSITEVSEDDCEYEEIPDDNFSIPEGEEDLTKAINIIQEQATDIEILEQTTVLPSKQVVHEAIEDFLCNFLIKMEMNRTLDSFQAEWYELIQKGKTEFSEIGNVPDVYSQVMLLETENKNLKKDLKHFKQAAEKAREELLRTQKERDFHRMHHKRTVQEKNKLIADLKGLKLHYASYEPTIRVLHEKHHVLLKEKMLTSLERDQAVGKISGLQASLKNTEIAHIHIPKIKAGYSCEKENKSEAPTQKGLHESKQDSGYKTKMKDDRKDSEFPTNMQPDTDLNVCDENIGPSKFDYKLNNIFRLHDLPVTCINMHPCKEFLVSCSEDRLWKMVGLPKGNVFLTGSGHTDWLADCCFHPSGTKLATSSGDSTIKLWDLSTGECLLTFEGHSHAVWSCTWHSSGDFVASASLDMTSKIWDINSERCRYTLYGHTDSVNSIEFFPFSNTLLTASADKTLSVWDARTSKCEHSLYGHMHSINDATFTPRGHIIASCDARGVIKLWDFRNLIPIVSIDVGPSAGNEVNFDSTGRVLAQASASGIIHLLDLKTGQIHKLVGHENEVHTVVFSQDGKNMYSGGSDGTVRLWL